MGKITIAIKININPDSDTKCFICRKKYGDERNGCRFLSDCEYKCVLFDKKVRFRRRNTHSHYMERLKECIECERIFNILKDTFPLRN